MEQKNFSTVKIILSSTVNSNFYTARADYNSETVTEIIHLKVLFKGSACYSFPEKRKLSLYGLWDWD